MEPNFESKEMLGVRHSDTNSSHYTEPEDCAAEILHVWLLVGGVFLYVLENLKYHCLLQTALPF